MQNDHIRVFYGLDASNIRHEYSTKHGLDNIACFLVANNFHL